MGKQFRFIMDKNDEKEFLEYVRHEGRVFENKKKLGCTDIVSIPEYIWINLYLYKDEFGSLELKKYCDDKKYIDVTVSPVIEFGETLLRENVKEIQRGRLYVEVKYYNKSGGIERKNILLDKWYKELVKWIKENFSFMIREIRNIGEYIQ